AIAAQLIWLKSRRLLPGDPLPGVEGGTDEPDEDDLRLRLIEYRAIRDAALWLSAHDGLAPLMRREPRDSDLPEAPLVALPRGLLAASLERLAAAPEPEAPPSEVVAREITIGMQLRVLLDALSERGRTTLRADIAGCQYRM